MALFSSDLQATIFYTVYILWFLSEFVGAWVIPRLRNRSSVRTRSDRGSAVLIFASVLVGIGIVFSFAYSGITSLPNWVFYPGIVLMVLGIMIRQWAIAVLGRFFSLAVEIASDHRVVDNGPYRWVRHPSYTGALLTLFGLGLALQSWGAILAIGVIFGIAYGYRIRVEENALVKQLGQDYLAYMSRTKRLIPLII